MIFIVGLGNPGEKYKNTRHNAGFLTVEEFAMQNGFPDFRFSVKLQAEISEGLFGDEKIILAKPQTFMNESGKAVKMLNTKYKIPRTRAFSTVRGRPRTAPEEIIRGRQDTSLLVIHDDIDLPLGKIRIARNRGPAGHKGVESVIRELGTKNFTRFRIGIKPAHKLQAAAIEKFVLQKFAKEEERIIKETLGQTVKAIEVAITAGLEKAMAEHN